MSDSTLEGSEQRGHVNDPDDVSAMAGYLLLANEKVFQAWSQRIHDELLRRARAATGATPAP